MPAYRPAMERFLEKVDLSDPTSCWLWTAALNNNACYGVFWDGTRNVVAHRWAYESLVGPVPEGLVLDHLCRTARCVNPDHLEEVTQRENLMRGQSPRIVTHLTGICQRGHSMDDALTSTKSSWRTCRTCFNEGQRRRYAEARAE